MNCQSCHPLLIDRVLGELTAEQSAAVAQHLEICETCRRESDQLQRDFALLGETAESTAPPAGVKSRLLASIHAPSALPSAPSSEGMSEAPQSIPFTPPPTAASPTKRLFAAALVGVAVGGLVTYALQNTVARRAAESARAQALAEANQELDQAMQAARRLTPGAVLRTAAFSSQRRPDMAALFTWDIPSGQIHFHAVGLAPPPAGKVYRLWLIDDNDKWISAGELTSAQPGADPAETRAYQLLGPPPKSERPFQAAALTLDDAAADSPAGEVISRSAFLSSTPPQSQPDASAVPE